MVGDKRERQRTTFGTSLGKGNKGFLRQLKCEFRSYEFMELWILEIMGIEVWVCTSARADVPTTTWYIPHS